MSDENCPKCGAPLGDITETATARKLQRCTQGSWNPQTKQNEGCDFVKWLQVEPQTLDEKCPKCESYHDNEKHCPDADKAWIYSKWKHSKGFSALNSL